MSLWEGVRAFSKWAAGAPMPRLNELTFEIENERTANDIKPETDYFGLTINQIYLARGRELFAEYDPLLYTAVDFVHGSDRITVPKLIGPSALKQSLPEGQNSLPHGFIVRDIRVAGPHPYRGEPVGVTVILYKVQSTDYAKRVLKIAEGLSQTLGVPAEIATLGKIGNSIVDSFEALFGMGVIEPVLGHRLERNAIPGDGLKQHAVALIGDTKPVDSTQLRIRDHRLLGANGEDYTDNDFVLYAVWKAESVENESRLSFYPSVLKMYQAAGAGDDASWLRAKATLASVYQEMLQSPDLSMTDADNLFDKYKSTILKKRKIVTTISTMGSGDGGRGYKDDVIKNQLNARTEEAMRLTG